MNLSLAQFRERLDGTWLRARRATSLVIPETTDLAFAVQCGPEDLERFWDDCVGLSTAVGRFPVLTATIGSGRAVDWLSAVRSEEFFNRFEYTHEPGGVVAPDAILRAADTVDVPAFLLQLDILRRSDEAQIEALADRQGALRPLPKRLPSELEGVRREFGIAPSAEAVVGAIGPDNAGDSHAIEKYLLNWEAERGYGRDAAQARQPWFEAEAHGHLALLFLPIAASWDALAYLHWFGVSRFSSSSAIALGRAWRKAYGAELVAHFGTVLQCVVSNPPSTVESAWKLAREHDLLSPGTLAPSGTLLRHYAHGLVGQHRWLMHERP